MKTILLVLLVLAIGYMLGSSKSSPIAFVPPPTMANGVALDEKLIERKKALWLSTYQEACKQGGISTSGAAQLADNAVVAVYGGTLVR